jgi:phosphate starvation-inducible protein PhoH
MQNSYKVQKQSYPKRIKTNKQRNEINFLSKSLEKNAKAYEEGPRSKKWTRHDLRSIKPLTPAQEDLFKAFFEGNHICAYGTAGTGKSYCLIWLALSELFREESKQNRIIIVRSCVPTRDIGFLPGTEEEKMAVYERPYIDIVGDIIGKSNAYEDMKKSGIVEFTTTSNIRGVTWNDAIVIIDEAQNMTLHELNSVMGRIGKNTRVNIMGDTAQNDLIKKKGDETGFPIFLKIIDTMKEFEKVLFQRHDIVRSSFVKSWISSYEDYMQTLV